MLKHLLLLVLCVPFGLVIYHEGQDLFRKHVLDAGAVENRLPADLEKGLSEAKGTAAEFERVRPEVWRTVVRLSEESPSPQEFGAPKVEERLLPGVGAYAKYLADA